jgi:CRISPR/Cas system-associated exonuclease Cas4 (RecB family)
MTIYNKPLSPSSITTYLSCPYKWYLKYVKGIKIPPGDAAIFGSFCHKVYEYFWDFYTPGSDPRVSISKAADKYISSPRDTHPNIDGEYEEAAYICLENFVSIVEKHPTDIPIHKELKCENITNNTVAIIDVVYPNKIVDYKTSTQYTIKPKLPNQIQAIMCIQNLLEVHYLDIKEVEFWYTRFKKYQYVTVNSNLVNDVNNIIDEVRQSIKEDNFPKIEKDCFFCDYKLICDSEKKQLKYKQTRMVKSW